MPELTAAGTSAAPNAFKIASLRWFGVTVIPISHFKIMVLGEAYAAIMASFWHLKAARLAHVPFLKAVNAAITQTVQAPAAT
jgi:hypothetical protein